MQKLLAILIVIVCTVLLQAHSIPFWLDHSNDYIGYLWSFTIEGVALWLWLNKKMVLATIASAIVILIPLVHLSTPLLKEIRLVNANVLISELNHLGLKQSELLQDKYLSTNWAGRQKENIIQLRESINEQKTHLIESSKQKDNRENILIISLQCISLVVIMLAQILALKTLSFHSLSSMKYMRNVEKYKPIKKELRDKKRSFNSIQRRIIFHKAKGKCAYCSRKLVWDAGSKKSFQADHVIPHSMGGETKLDNGQALCSSCNISKGNKLEGSFKKPKKFKEFNRFHSEKQNVLLNPSELLTEIESYLYANGVSQALFAKECNISPSSISRLKARVGGDEKAISNELIKTLEVNFKELKSKKEVENV